MDPEAPSETACLWGYPLNWRTPIGTYLSFPATVLSGTMRWSWTRRCVINLPVIAIVGNDARWNAEQQLQIQKYGVDRVVGCDLLASRYDKVAEALGGYGEFVRHPDQLTPALERAVQSGSPACVNVAIEGAKAPTFRSRAEGVVDSHH